MAMLYPNEQPDIAVGFGRRKVAARACIADGKVHIRNFLSEALEELGFITCECEQPDGLRALVELERPDLIVLGLSGGGIAANEILERLALMQFAGKVLVFGPGGSPMVTAIAGVGEQLGLTMLPLLPTPFSDQELRSRVISLLPAESPPSPPVDVGEALHANWLDLWYQPKIDIRSMSLQGAEALVRLRHPTWGTLTASEFVPDENDPHFAALSDFVMTRAIEDWHYFVGEYGHVEIAINLPVAFFENLHAIESLTRRIPAHPAFEGLLIEFNGPDLTQNLPLAKKVARLLRFHNIGISVGGLGAEWPALMELTDFPFVEIKVDRSFVTGCGDDRLKRSACRSILELADGFGARTVAEGVETRTDFVAARELGFDLIQGFFLAKPMEPQKFARKVLSRPVTLAQ